MERPEIRLCQPPLYNHDGKVIGRRADKQGPRLSIIDYQYGTRLKSKSLLLDQTLLKLKELGRICHAKNIEKSWSHSLGYKFTPIKRSKLINEIIIKDKQEKTCMLIDIYGNPDRNTSAKVAEKLSKYKGLEIEITGMWGLKMITVPVVIGALGVLKKGIEKH